ncbi:acyltransferase family protein [Caulobacter flavus]|uniref:acyltransferase family protein n=1 Tax=Caulobacter flavus TaxID=1679497 RepID=UPI0013DE6E19|nr:acyltransferase [Caulobacter flavus]
MRLLAGLGRGEAAPQAAAGLPKNLALVQALRGVAAIAVVAHHAIRTFTVKASAGIVPPALIGAPAFYDSLAFGVDLFFVISGFIMVYVSGAYMAADKPILGFLLKRAARIYPIYIIVSLALIAIKAMNHLTEGASGFDLQPLRIVTSLLLVPAWNEAGGVQPILGVGWTLSYELYFYLLFAAAVVVARRAFFAPLAAFILLAVTAFNLLPGGGTAIASFLANPIAIEFLFGCLVALAIKRGARMPLPWLSIAAASAALFVGPLFVHAEAWRVLVWGLPSAVVVFSAVSLEVDGKVARTPRLFGLLGDASYSIYLVHILIVGIVGARVGRMVSAAVGTGYASTAAVAGIVVLAVLVGVALYFAVERPMADFLAKRIGAYERARLGRVSKVPA